MLSCAEKRANRERAKRPPLIALMAKPMQTKLDASLSRNSPSKNLYQSLEDRNPGSAIESVHQALFELLETAKREFERDREAAKASLATASSMRQSEIDRHSRARSTRPGALADWQMARVRAFIDENLHRTIHAKDCEIALSVSFFDHAHLCRVFR